MLLVSELEIPGEENALRIAGSVDTGDAGADNTLRIAGLILEILERTTR